MTIISRIELDHPPLGQSGGSSLHTQIEAIYEKLGDACNPRFYRIEDLVDGLSVDLDHNYQVDFSTIRWDLYTWDTGTGELTYIADTSGYQVLATPGNETTQLRIVNNTGAEQDLVAQLFNDPIFLTELQNVDLETTPPEDGQALVYQDSNDTWVAGASGDSSFKLQSIAGETLTIKSGFLILGSGVEVYAPNDMDVDFSIAERQANGDYTVFINLSLLPDETDLNGRPVRIVTAAEIGTDRTAKPYQLDLVKQAPIGTVERNLGVLENPQTLATRRHTNDTATISALEFELPKQDIGAVGEVDNIRAGHVLTTNSLPSSSTGSFFNLANNANDNSGQSRNLSDNGTPVYGQTGIKGVAGAVQLNGTDAFLSSTNAYFNPGGSAFTCGGWFNQDSIPANSFLFSQWETNNKSFGVRTLFGELAIMWSTDGTTTETTNQGPFTASQDEWFHFALAYDGSKFLIYINGVTVSSLDVGVLFTSATPSFEIGSQTSAGTGFFPGFIDEFFFDQSYYSDDDIAKIFAHQLDHNRNVETSSQRWIANLRSGDHATPVYDFLVDTDLDRCWIDLFGQADSSAISIKMYDDGSLGSTTAVRSMERQVTASELDAQLPIAHRFPTKPTAMELWVEVSGGDFEQVDTSAYLLANDTQIVSTGITLASVLGSGTNVHLIASVGAQAVVVNEVTQTTGGGSGEAGINYVQNPDAEQDATTGTVQVNVTTTEETGTPLIGAQSFRVLSQGVADGYHGWVLDPIDNAFVDSTKLKFTGIVDCDQEGWAVDIWNDTDSMQVVGTESDLPVGQSTFSVGAVPETGKTYLPRLVTKTAANGSIAVADKIFHGFTQTGATDLNGWKSYDNTVVNMSTNGGNEEIRDAIFTPEKDPITGIWFLNVITTITHDGATSITLTIPGLTFTNSSNYFQASALSPSNVGIVFRGFAQPNTNTILAQYNSNSSFTMINGRFQLIDKPSWADYEPTGVALNNETLNANARSRYYRDAAYVYNQGTTFEFDTQDTATYETVAGITNSSGVITVHSDGTYDITVCCACSPFWSTNTLLEIFVDRGSGFTSERTLDRMQGGSSHIQGNASISLNDSDSFEIRLNDATARTVLTTLKDTYIEVTKRNNFTSETTVVADIAQGGLAGFLEYYNKTTVALDNNFTSGNAVITRINDTVSITFDSVASHSNSSVPTTSAGLVPDWARPTITIDNCCRYDSSSSYGLQVGANGNLLTFYSNETGGVNRTDTFIIMHITYVIT